MNLADQARENAIHCEMKKCALRQSKEGIIVSFVLHPHEVPSELQTADIGSRWMVVLVQLGDDETPVQQPAKELPASEPHSGRASWRDLQPAAQAGIRCADPIFRAFLKEEFGFDAKDQNAAAIVVRQLCAVSSRRELNVIPVNWNTLDDKFLAWKYVDA